MKTSETNIWGGMDRLNGLMAWWGFPNVGDGDGMAGRVTQFQSLMLDLNKLFNDASSRQAQAFSAASEQLTLAVQELLSARRPPDVMAAQAKLLTGLMESMAGQTGVWAELTQKLRECCSAAACDAEEATGERTERQAPSKSRSAATRSTATESARHAAQI